MPLKLWDNNEANFLFHVLRNDNISPFVHGDQSVPFSLAYPRENMENNGALSRSGTLWSLKVTDPHPSESYFMLLYAKLFPLLLGHPLLGASIYWDHLLSQWVRVSCYSADFTKSHSFPLSIKEFHIPGFATEWWQHTLK